MFEITSCQLFSQDGGRLEARARAVNTLHAAADQLLCGHLAGASRAVSCSAKMASQGYSLH